MFLKDFIKLSLKLIISIYFCAVLVFILLNVGSSEWNLLTDALSPIKLFEEIISGNFLFIMYTTIGTVFIFRFNYLRRKKVDYEDGGRVCRGQNNLLINKYYFYLHFKHTSSSTPTADKSGQAATLESTD